MVDEAEALLEIYTDDPTIAIVANQGRTHRIAAMMVMMWRAIGFALACHKAQLDHRVTWFGYEIEDKCDMILARIKAEFMTTLAQNIDDALKKNVISLKELRSLTGCVNYVASHPGVAALHR